MPPAKPQGTTVAVGKTNLAKRPAPTPGEQGRRKAAKRSGRTSPGTPGMLPASAAPATPSRGGGHCPTLRGGRRGGNAPLYVSVFFWDGRSLMSWHAAPKAPLPHDPTPCSAGHPGARGHSSVPPRPLVVDIMQRRPAPLAVSPLDLRGRAHRR